jgi:hypothetical protein
MWMIGRVGGETHLFRELIVSCAIQLELVSAVSENVAHAVTWSEIALLSDKYKRAIFHASLCCRIILHFASPCPAS